MVVDEEHREPLGAAGGPSPAVLEALVAGGRALVDAPSLVAALQRILAGGADVLGAEAVIARVLDDDGQLVARAVHASSTSLAAELDGTAVAAEHVAGGPIETLEHVPPVVRAAAVRLGAAGVLVLPVTARNRLVGSLDVLWRASATDRAHGTLARLVADQVGAAIVAFGTQGGDGMPRRDNTLDLAGDALAVGVEPSRAANEVARLAVRASGARAAHVWRPAASGLEERAAFGDPLTPDELTWAREVASGAFAAGTRVSVVESAGDDGEVTALTLLLGQPGSDVLQLVFEPRSAPRPQDAERIAAFALRASAALRASERSGAVEQELEQTRTLLSVVAQVNADLSLTRRLTTFVDRVAELLDVERVCVYLREDGRLVPAAERALAGPHTPVAERLLTLALGRPAAQGVLEVESAGADSRLAAVRGELAETGIETAIAIPLRVPDEVTGLLALYPSRLRRLSANESALLTALAARLAVALQNARLHEEATRLGTELEGVLALERQAASQLRALYEISRSFAQSLSLDKTLDAVVRTVVELLEVDAAVIRMPDERGELLVPARIHVPDQRLRAALDPILSRPQPIARLPGRRLFRMGKALILDTASAGRFGGAHQALVPFLAQGATAVVIPIATPNDLLGTLKLLSLDPDRPITDDAVEIGLTLAAQAALAIDNARLYQQQKAFNDAMQRSLLPRSRPDMPGVEVGEVYESSARVDVGGDVYDFLALDDGRLAVVMGDVTGHGIDAASDMAMAKFVFRSLAREHPEPGEFLTAANDVVCGEIAAGKFITMLYLTLDPSTEVVTCAGAGHPPPRIVLPDGEVYSLDARGLALGIEEGQRYDEVRETLPAGAAVVLYTDGVIEARNDGEFYGTERLDATLSRLRGLPAPELAEAVLAECRKFGGGDLADDCALVVIKRTAT